MRRDSLTPAHLCVRSLTAYSATTSVHCLRKLRLKMGGIRVATVEYAELAIKIPLYISMLHCFHAQALRLLTTHQSS